MRTEGTREIPKCKSSPCTKQAALVNGLTTGMKESKKITSICAWVQNAVSKEASWIAEEHWLVLDAGRDSVSGCPHAGTAVST